MKEENHTSSQFQNMISNTIFKSDRKIKIETGQNSYYKNRNRTEEANKKRPSVLFQTVRGNELQ